MNEFGKFTRKLRIDRGELLKDMSCKLIVSPAYLSAVEIGKRNIPQDWIDILYKAYLLTTKQINELKQAYAQSCNEIKLNMKGATNEQKNLAIEFMEGFARLDEKDIHELSKILAKSTRRNIND